MRSVPDHIISQRFFKSGQNGERYDQRRGAKGDGTDRNAGDNRDKTILRRGITTGRRTSSVADESARYVERIKDRLFQGKSEP
jgi:hypothetical protein